MAALRPALIRHAMLLTGNLADAEDLVQTAFEKTWRRRWLLKSDTRLQALLAKITRNLAIDQFRSSWRSRVTSMDLSEIPGREPEPTPWWHEVEVEDLSEALTSCPRTLRESFELRHYQRLSLSQIAARTGAPVNTVATRIFRARAHVRGALEANHRRAA